MLHCLAGFAFLRCGERVVAVRPGSERSTLVNPRQFGQRRHVRLPSSSRAPVPAQRAGAGCGPAGQCGSYSGDKGRELDVPGCGPKKAARRQGGEANRCSLTLWDYRADVEPEGIGVRVSEQLRTSLASRGTGRADGVRRRDRHAVKQAQGNFGAARGPFTRRPCQ